MLRNTWKKVLCQEMLDTQISTYKQVWVMVKANGKQSI